MDQKAVRKYFSVIIGAGCNAKCPFCISPALMKNSTGDIHREEVENALAVAREFGCEVASVSGGGEPLLLARKTLNSGSE